ncbi:MAG TPA: ABC transporter ATP-binding protein [Solibacterales bacterium]|nr:ABC transporter ATP-binding protein [Bryobacterales bacterium]
MPAASSSPAGPIIEFRGVSKSYPIYESPADRLKELAALNRRSFHRDFWALRDISFQIHRGETFCVVGENGSGKSTLLQLVAGILKPSEGTVRVDGRVAALLELGSGFNPEFTGKDNVYLNAAILGLGTAEIDRKYKDIENFAEIGEFIHQPVKTYSSGMAVRLAFSVAIHVDPDILLVDEALAVGDIYFRQRCLRKVHELRDRGVTILFVSHAVGDVKAIGDRTVWLDQGQVRELGATDVVVSKYLAAMTAKDARYIEQAPLPRVAPGATAATAPEVVTHIPNVDHRHGDGGGEIIGIAILDARGRAVQLLEPGGTVIVRISAQAHETIDRPMVGFMLRNHMGLDFAGTNTTREGHILPPMTPGDIVTIDFHIQLPELYPTTFSFSPAIADGSLHAYKMCDWIDNAVALQMGHGEAQIYGYIHLPCTVEVNARLHNTEAPVSHV